MDQAAVPALRSSSLPDGGVLVISAPLSAIIETAAILEASASGIWLKQVRISEHKVIVRCSSIISTDELAVQPEEIEANASVHVVVKSIRLSFTTLTVASFSVDKPISAIGRLL